VINIMYTPQRADYKAEYTTKDDVLIVTIDGVEEFFDFTDIPEGAAEEIVVEELPVNPIVSVEKTDDVVGITVVQFYGEDEKALYEVVQSG